MDNINASRLNKPSKFSQLNLIADPQWFFLQTPKTHAIQLITWSNYKHHKTEKIFIAVAPNGLISFEVESYGGNKHFILVTLLYLCHIVK